MVLKLWSLGQQHEHALELVKNVNSYVTPKIYRIRNSGVEAQQSVL